MGYVAVTGGQKAIEKAEKLVLAYRLDGVENILETNEVEKQFRLLIDRVMGEGGLYAPNYAALALKQAEGDPAEAAFLLRAYRSTLQRNHYSLTAEPSTMRVIRRISSSFKEIPGGQMLGPTYDYTHRLLNFNLHNEEKAPLEEFLQQFDLEIEETEIPTFQKIADLLREQGLLSNGVNQEVEPFDVTREKLTFPASRSARLQVLTRGETGTMTALAYSSMRGYGVVHPTIGELRVGYTDVHIPYPFGEEDDFVYIGEVLLTEVETINSFTQNDQGEVEFMLGYGLTIGQNEVKAIAMAILERSLEMAGSSPTQDEEFVLLHVDTVEAHGFVSHLKLPHYITFQSMLDRIRHVQDGGKVKRKAGQQQDSEATFSHS